MTTHSPGYKVDLRTQANAPSSWLIVDCLLHQLTKCVVYILITNVGDQLGNDLGVCLGLKHESLGHQELLYVLEVGDDAVVDHNEIVVVSRHLVTRIA